MQPPTSAQKTEHPPELNAVLKPILEAQHDAIEAWFTRHYAQTEPLFYSSVDLRHAGFKLSPVDTNLFPAGFNLLSQKALERASNTVKDYIAANHAGAKKLLLIPDNHTRNTYYLQNIVALRTILSNAGLEVECGSLIAEEPLEVESADGTKLTLHPLIKDTHTLGTKDFTPDIILVNNDLSTGAPDLLQERSQPIIPPVGLGWFQRRKTRHFESYNEVSRKFAAEFNFDPWLISAAFSKCGTINFKERKGLECVALGVERCLSQVKKKYAEYGITQKPYAFIKADTGTYGMGIMTVSDPQEVMDINKKDRKKMDVIKEGVHNSEVIIQEGVPTTDTVDGKVAEPLMYLINGLPIGCTYRINENRDALGNLNAPGMTFSNACERDDEAGMQEDQLCPIRNLVARLASLAAARECYEPQWEI